MLSIIIPLYNKENEIVNTLNTVLNQDFHDYEIVVIDDGSTDKSVEQVLSIADDRIKVYKKENGGVSSARNYGIEKAKYDWLMFLDADDMLMPHALQRFTDAISSHPSIEVFISNFFIAELNGKPVAYSKLSEERILQNPIRYIWERKCYSRPGNTIFKRTVLEQQGGYDAGLTYNEDYEFALRILSYRKAYYLPFMSMTYKKVENSASSFTHSLDRDFISKIPLLALDSLYKRLIIFNLLKYTIKRRYNDRNYIESIIRGNFRNNFICIYFIFVLLRKIKKL